MCGGVYRESGATLRSPYHPDPYPSNKQCEYLIQAPEGSAVTLTFSAFNMENSEDQLCRYDYVEVSKKTKVLISSWVSPGLCVCWGG